MLNQVCRKLVGIGLVLAVSVYAQKIPVKEPHLIPFPSLESGISYFTLVPTQNLILAPGSGGWTVKDTIRQFAISIDLELVRYRWGDLVFDSPRYDSYSSLGYSIFNQLGSTTLPANYPASFELNQTVLSGFVMNPLIKELYLDHRFIYNYSARGSLQANIATGFTKLSLYKNSSGVRILESSGLGLHFGIGWKATLLGRTGERIRFGVDLGYSIRSFDIGDQEPNLKLSNGTDGALSPIQSISFNTPDLKISLELGERFLSAHSPYRDPYKLGILNLSSGSGLVNFQHGTSIRYDTSGVDLPLPFFSRISQNYDLQVIKYNWPFHFIKQANIDGLSGLGIRYWKLLQQTSLPSGWARNFTDGSTEYSSMAFSPKVIDIYVDHEIIYPMGPRLHAKVRAGTGYANMTLYENIKLEKLIKSSAMTWQLGGGFSYAFKGDGSSMVVIGLSASYYHQAFDIDMDGSGLVAIDPTEIMPLTHIDFSQPVISFDIGLLFGGASNAAHRAHQAFKEKRFTEALEIQTELLSAFPDHHNSEIMLLERQMIEDTLVTHYYRDAYQVLSVGELNTAYTLLERGKIPPTEGVKGAIAGMRTTISDQALEKASEALKQLDFESAEEMVLLALRSDPSSLPVAKVLLARAYIIRATILHQTGTYGRSLYWLKQADGLTDRYKTVTDDMRKKIGEGRLDDANEGILRKDRKMVYQSMQDAKALNPVLRDVVDEHLKDLEQAIEYESNQQLVSLKRMTLDNLLNDVAGLDPENFTPRIGMQGAALSNYVGPPTRSFTEGDYELWTYPRPEGVELWLYLRNGIIEKIEFKQ